MVIITHTHTTVFYHKLPLLYYAGKAASSQRRLLCVKCRWYVGNVLAPMGKMMQEENVADLTSGADKKAPAMARANKEY